MILNENQKEMYSNCIFLNERFNSDEKYNINNFNKEKILNVVKSEIDKLKKKNSKIKGITIDQITKGNLDKKKINMTLKSGYNLVNWVTEVRRYSKNLKFNYNDFSECLLCRKQGGLIPDDWQYAILIFYLQPYDKPYNVSCGKGKYKTYEYALKVKKIKMDKSYLKLNENQLDIQRNSMFLSETIELKDLLKLSGEKFTKAMQYCAKFAKNAVTREKFKKAKLTGNLAEIKELLEPDCVQAFILAGNIACEKFLLPFLAEYFTNGAVTTKEKEAKVKQLKNDLKEVERIAEEEFDTGLKKINEQGIAYFKENVNEVIKPYKL